MDLAIGALGSLLPKLGEVLIQELGFLKGVKKDLEYLEGELSNIHGALGKIAEAPPDEVSPEDKIWACNLRELSYDMEDVVDSFLLSVDGSEGDPNNPNTKTFKFKGLMGKMCERFDSVMGKMFNLFKQAKERRRIVIAIKDFREQAEQVASWHKRYKNRALDARTKTTVDPFLVARYKEGHKIIGVDGARDEIIAKLCEGDDASKLQLKILSIVGFGGLGKTTLAKAVYDSLEIPFDCRAFVSVSRIFNAMEVFKDIFCQLDGREYKNSNIAELFTESQLIDELRRLLKERRYFVVVDDIWDINAWNTIRYALQDNDNGSIIITTTRNFNISKRCCSPNSDMNYIMKALSKPYSRRLFHEIIFGSNNNCPLELEKVSRDILKKCGGVPLAIITLASYLANGPNEHRKANDKWFTLLNSIGHGIVKGDESVNNMKKILSFSYYDLPPHLKACLLYLSAFPEDYIIGKERLIRRWIAEGFVKEEMGTSQIETAESYFSDLINRSMVEPRNIHADGSVEACCVHDMMLDLIRDLSREENFVTILGVMKASNGKEVVLKENTHSERKPRRLSVQEGMVDVNTAQLDTRSLSQVRSITVFNPAINHILTLTEFDVLRVLDLEGSNLQESCHIDLRHVKHLSHLRYLGLRGTKVGSLPVEIGKLRLLQTLDVQGINAEELPSSVVQLEHLMCLNLGPGMELPEGFSKMKFLEQLTGLWAGFSSKDKAKELRHLTRLRELALKWKWKQGEDLLESLCCLQKLESLDILSCDWYVDMNDLKPSPNLRRFRVGGYVESLPKWINSSSVPVLSYIDLYLCEVRTEDIQSLGMLQTLRYVSVEMSNTSSRDTRKRKRTEHNIVENLVLTAGAFPCARVCLFNKVVLIRPIIQKGAMQMVQRLRCGLQPCKIDSDNFDLSIPNLPSLEQLRIDIKTRGSTSDECSRAIDMLKRAAEDHPRRPILRYAEFIF